MALLVPKVLLLLLSVLGFWTLWGFPYRNGMLRILSDLHKKGASIPGPTVSPMKQVYTGIPPIDYQLTTLVAFFYTAIDGNRVDVSLEGLNLGGQVVAAWILMYIESMRAGNRKNLWITSITTLGLLLQNIGFACIAPIWFAIQLSTSPVVSPHDFDLIVSPPFHAAIAPISIALGYGIPSVLMCLPAPKMVSFDFKQLWAGIQQAWPIWIAITQLLLTIIVSSLNPMVSIMTEADKKRKTIKYLRWAYAFALISSAAGRLIPVGISMLAYAFPVLFNPVYLPYLQPGHIFQPVSPFGSLHADTLADGALWFLQWDVLVGSMAVAIWALTLRMASRHEEAPVLEWITATLGLGVVATMIGGSGAAVVAVWGRDELVFRSAAEEDKKQK